ncbi:PEP-CTERM sorting domain-containing protein [Paludisphaera soli]|uniref:PEP-CTERM sorting domain-containing protein n=1 Tax=Paludisphaera soli TaxID=2712865 RepID=UPI0013EB4B0E|nr:PEP-CTERM sorting domain-containing protein [Paludisphaera soli]
MRRRFLLCTAAFLSLPALVHAEMTTFTRRVVADFEFSLVAGTPFNPGPVDSPFIPFQAVGDLTFRLDPSLNDASQPTTVPFLDATGVLQGTKPLDFGPFTISPNVAFLGGELTNIVRDGSGEVISADVRDLLMEWELVGPGFGRLYGRVGLDFDADGVSIPFAYGTVLYGPTPFDVYSDDGDGDTSNDVRVAVGRNRTLRVVPEPTSAALLALGGAGLLAFARRRA